MRLTPIEDIRAGFIWVREIREFERGPWLIAEIKGIYPFLYGYAITERDRVERYRITIENPNEWEFGPKIEEPSETTDD